MKYLISTISAFWLCMAIAFGQAGAGENMVTKASLYTLEETVQRLKSGITDMGMNLMAEIDHAGAAEANKLELRPTYLLLFGNPQVGTLLMQADQRVGLALPLRVLVWKSEHGKVYITYYRITSLQKEYSLDEQSAVLEKMASVLEKLAQVVTE